MTHTPPLSLDTLLTLAPIELATYRNDRYLGDALNVSLQVFALADQRIVQQLYEHLQALLQILETKREQNQETVEAVKLFTHKVDWNKFVSHVQRLGNATTTLKTPLVRQVIHDIKSGSFTALAILVQFLAMGFATTADLQQLTFLTRDHLLIMRNSVRDVDYERFIPDRRNHTQHIEELTKAWANATYTLPEQSAQVVFTSDFWGDICAAPIEFAALTRVFYNLLNNAVKYSNDNYVYVSLLSLPQGKPRDVRFVLYNQISTEHYKIIEKHYPDDLGYLFRGGFTTGGSGLGMRTCAEHVAGDYGLAKVELCVERGYVGATYHNSYFVTWFHWPAAHNTLQSEAGTVRSVGSEIEPK